MFLDQKSKMYAFSCLIFIYTYIYSKTHTHIQAVWLYGKLWILKIKKWTKCLKKWVNLHWMIVSTWHSENHKNLKKLISRLKLTFNSWYWICLLNANIFRHDVGKYRDGRYSPHVMGRKSILTPLGLLLSLTGWLWWGRERGKTKKTYECLALVSPN